MPNSIDYLITGYKKFRKQYFDNDNTVFENLVVHGQSPRFLVIACSDSRVDPALVLNCKPGDLFVIRNVANLIPPYEKDSGYHGTSAALEFGICGLGIKHIIIFGHTQCGGITSLMQKNPTNKSESFIAKWMELANSARDQTLAEHPTLPLAEQADICCTYALKNSLENLRSFPWIKEKVDSGELFLHAWYFDLAHGSLHALTSSGEGFAEL